MRTLCLRYTIDIVGNSFDVFFGYFWSKSHICKEEPQSM